mgnify:CR=1 FL=1
MKKVLALVLAVVMVCTMAMAVNVGGTTTVTPPTSSYQYSKVINPGQSIIFDKGDLTNGTSVTLNDDDIKDGKIKVTVAFERGADKIASQGWVKDGADWKYILTTKEGVVAADGTPDIIIASIVVTKTGVYAPLNEMKFVGTKDGKTTYAYSNLALPNLGTGDKNTMSFIMDPANNVGLCLGFDYGYSTGKIVLDAKGNGYTANPTVTAGILYSVERDAVVNAKFSAVAGAAVSPFTYSYTLKAGETVMFTELGAVDTSTTSAAGKALNKNLLDHDAIVVDSFGTAGLYMPNKAVTLAVDNAKDGYKLYMVKADGSVVDLNAKFDDNKVLTATATLTGPVIVTDKALTAVGTTSTGTTTNPGTGANDVVGVAAALAVVALVSGAAISLKK